MREKIAPRNLVDSHLFFQFRTCGPLRYIWSFDSIGFPIILASNDSPVLLRVVSKRSLSLRSFQKSMNPQRAYAASALRRVTCNIDSLAKKRKLNNISPSETGSMLKYLTNVPTNAISEPDSPSDQPSNSDTIVVDVDDNNNNSSDHKFMKSNTNSNSNNFYFCSKHRLSLVWVFSVFLIYISYDIEKIAK